MKFPERDPLTENLPSIEFLVVVGGVVVSLPPKLLPQTSEKVLYFLSLLCALHEVQMSLLDFFLGLRPQTKCFLSWFSSRVIFIPPHYVNSNTAYEANENEEHTSAFNPSYFYLLSIFSQGKFLVYNRELLQYRDIICHTSTYTCNNKIYCHYGNESLCLCNLNFIRGNYSIYKLVISLTTSCCQCCNFEFNYIYIYKY